METSEKRITARLLGPCFDERGVETRSAAHIIRLHETTADSVNSVGLLSQLKNSRWFRTHGVWAPRTGKRFVLADPRYPMTPRSTNAVNSRSVGGRLLLPIKKESGGANTL